MLSIPLEKIPMPFRICTRRDERRPRMSFVKYIGAFARMAQRPVWIALCPGRRGDQPCAEALGEFRADLPLFGVPFAIKDNIDLAGSSDDSGLSRFRLYSGGKDPPWWLRS